MVQYSIPCLKMNGKNESLLRRKRTHYKKSDAYTKKKQTSFNGKFDYSNEKSWWDCIERIAIAQSTIGVKSAMFCVESVVRNRELRRDGYIYCSPEELKRALWKMRQIYAHKKR